jgi:enterobacteria phage integrase
VPTKRKPLHTDWPDYLYERRGYYTWRHPVTRKEYGLGRDQTTAIEAATEANAHLKKGLLERISEPRRTLGQFLPIYREHMSAQTLSKRTVYARRSHLKAFERGLKSVPIGTRYEDAPPITEACAEFLNSYVKAGKRRTAKAMRSTLCDVFACMASKGWLAVNPVRDLKLPAPEVQRQRLTLDDYRAIYAVAAGVAPWLPRAMELGVVSLQRLEEVADMTFRGVHEERLRVVQRKTGARLRIPLQMRLNAIGVSLKDVIGRCRDLTQARHLVHHVEHQGKAKPGMRVHPQTISGAFTKARKRAGIVVPAGKTPPTFHELRSLGIRLYETEGYDPQSLAGHKDSATTALYRDDRGAEWIDVCWK